MNKEVFRGKAIALQLLVTVAIIKQEKVKMVFNLRWKK